MKKITSNIVLLLIILNFNTTNAQNLSTTTNNYLEPVTLPSCDANNPEVQFINTNTDWSHINDINKRIFCVAPGNYTSLGNIMISQSGTANDKRYLILHNGNNVHPGKLQTNELALYKLTLDNASHWVIDRQAANRSGSIIKITNGSSFNIINRMFTDNVGQSVFIGHQCNNNTIQNSRFQNMSLSARKHDVMCILLTHNFNAYAADYVEIKNTKVLNNEIVNQNDGLHINITISQSNPNVNQTGNMEGTIIDNNKIWVTSDIYVDYNGTPNPNGNRMYAENALDFKIGSANPNNPIMVSNNILWGYIPACTTDSFLSANGIALATHFGIYNLHAKNNVIFNSYGGFGAGVSADSPYALQNAEITDNLFVDCSNSSRPSYSAISVYEDDASLITRNTIFRGDNPAIIASYNTINTTSQHNIFIDAPSQDVSGLGVYTPNTEYTAQEAITAGYVNDFTFEYDVFTTNPKTITLESVLQSNCSDIPVSNIIVNVETYNNVIITWDGNPNANVWVYVHENNTTGSQHPATNGSYTFNTLGENYTFTVFVQGENNCDDPLTAEFSTSSTLNIDSYNLNNRIKIYPNPATTNLHITQNKVKIKNYTITNMLSKKIASGNLVNATIDINYLEKGIYFIKLSTENISINRKFIKQ